MQTVKLSIARDHFFGPIIMISDELQLSLRKLVYIQYLVRVEWETIGTGDLREAWRE